MLRYCSLEVLKRDHFHACLEATKSIFDRLRTLTSASGDGSSLVDGSLALGKTGTPALAINALATQTERDEQSGLANLVKGLGGLYRNPNGSRPSAQSLDQRGGTPRGADDRLDGASSPRRSEAWSEWRWRKVIQHLAERLRLGSGADGRAVPNPSDGLAQCLLVGVG